MRAVELWVGHDDNTMIPPRVKLRVKHAHGDACAACTRPLAPGDAWDTDHIVALCNGGKNAESNLQPLCSWCHPAKTRTDVAIKSANYKRDLKHSGLEAKKSRPMAGTKASGWKHKVSGGWERR